jgi:hypothetical protein
MENNDEKKKRPDFVARLPDGSVILGEVKTLADTITTTSGSIITDFRRLSETFDVTQNRIAQETNIEGRLEETNLNLKKLIELEEAGFKKAEKETKTQSRRFKISTLIAVAAIIVAIIIGVTRFLI